MINPPVIPHPELAAWLERAIEESPRTATQIATRWGNRPIQPLRKYRRGLVAPRPRLADELSDALDKPRNDLRAILGYELLPEPMVAGDIDGLLGRLRSKLEGFTEAQLRDIELIVESGIAVVGRPS